jgi:hypothetical protein
MPGSGAPGCATRDYSRLPSCLSRANRIGPAATKFRPHHAVDLYQASGGRVCRPGRIREKHAVVAGLEPVSGMMELPVRTLAVTFCLFLYTPAQTTFLQIVYVAERPGIPSVGGVMESGT